MQQNIVKLWSVGAEGHPPRLRRQIALSNQIGLFGMAATVPYQLFYLLYDIALYWPLFAANLLFMTVYLSVLWVNRSGRPTVASSLVVANAAAQVFAVTYCISTGAGVHLFYFTLGSVFPLLFFRARVPLLTAVLAGAAALYLICHFAFAPGTTPMPIPAPLLDVMYAGSVVGAIVLTGAFAFLFRVEIDRVETMLTQSNRELGRLTTTDQLTGLPNRRRLDETLAQEWGRMQRERAPLSVLMCDIDSFKRYNDYYGHRRGDACLQRVAAAMAQAVRRPPDMVARYGGEEFMVVLPDTDASGARHVAERVRAAVAELEIPHAQSQVAPVVTISIGAGTAAPGAPLSLEGLLRCADEALYAAKLGGRNRVASGEHA